MVVGFDLFINTCCVVCYSRRPLNKLLSKVEHLLGKNHEIDSFVHIFDAAISAITIVQMQTDDFQFRQM